MLGVDQTEIGVFDPKLHFLFTYLYSLIWFYLIFLIFSNKQDKLKTWRDFFIWIISHVLIL